VEVPFRQNGRLAWQGLEVFNFRERQAWIRWRERLLISAFAGTLALSLAVVIWEGLPHRIDRDGTQRSAGVLSYAGDLCDMSESIRCRFGNPNAKKVIYVVGDSHAGNLIYGLDKFFRADRIRGVGFIDQGCLFVYGTTRFIKGKRDKDCAKNVADAYRILSDVDDPIIIAGGVYAGIIGPVEADSPFKHSRAEYITYFEEQMTKSLKILGAENRRVLLVKASYETGVNIARCLSRPGGDIQDRLRTDCRPKDLESNIKLAADIDGVLERLATRFEGAVTIDPKSAFCDTVSCQVIESGNLLFRDSQHLTNEGSQFLVQKWRDKLVHWMTSVDNPGAHTEARH